MSDPIVPASANLRSGFPRKISLLLLLLFDTAIGFFLLFRARPEMSQLARLLLSDLCMGLVAGAGARLLFGKRAWFIRFISATASMIIGLLTLGWLTHWRTGLGPWYFWRSTIDWNGLAQLLLGIIVILLAMHAWSRPARAAASPQPVSPAAPRPASRNIRTRTRPRRRRAKNELPAQPAPAKITAMGEVHSRPAHPRGSKTNLLFRKPKVRLSRVEKHICPYCLESVSRKDPRGVVECEICHTLHHGDCWAIAGSCQVPHYTA